jgi:tripartite-type tricarboxylate transporter receptor subunit TctC
MIGFRIAPVGEERVMSLSNRASRALAFAGAILAWTALGARAQSPEAAYYRGKTVRMVVGYTAGGGFDLYARMIAPYLARALGASVIVENQPGAGGIAATNMMMTQPPDGLQIMLVNGMAAAFGQFTGQQGVRYDLAKFEHLGTVSGNPWVWLVHGDTPWKSALDVVNDHRKLMWSAGGPIDGLSDGAAFTCEALKLDCNIVLGYPGSNDSALSVAKGEMDMMYIVDTSAANYVKDGKIRVLATMSHGRSRLFPDTPTIFESVKMAPEDAALLDFHSTAEKLGRILVAPPGTPAARVAFLREAVKTTLNDPALVAEGERTQRPVGFIEAEATRKAALGIVSDPTPEQKKRMIDILARVEKK